VFVDGWYAPALSRPGALPPGTRAGSLREALSNGADAIEAHLSRLATVRDEPFTALNTAFLEDGAFVDVPAHARLAEPIHLLFLTTAATHPSMTHPRVLVVMGDDSRAAVVETYAAVGAAFDPGPGARALGPDTGGVRSFTNAVTEVVLGEHAVLEHGKLQRESVAGAHVASMHFLARRGASATSHSLAFGGGLVRNDVVAVLDGEGAGCTLNGLYLADGARLVDNHTTIDHAQPHCSSRETYTGILAGHARAVFNGRIVVRPDAQQTDAKQTNRALLLSEDARINTTPQLEILANDVKCTHGAAVGQLDEEALFYLRSRGLGAPEARHMLIRAFAGAVLDRMALAGVRQEAERALNGGLERLQRAA
jgi:Fe-S cluster assembly protein SufD